WAADPDAAHLGRLLFFDPGLSGDGTISCATCHDPALAFTDGKALAEGVGLLGRHTPTVIDGAYQRWFFWDGRADSLWAQVAGPLEHPLEMNGSRLAALHHVAETPHLRLNYEQVFGPLPAISDARRFPRSARPMADTQHADAKAWSAMAAADRDLVNRTFSNLAKSIAAFERLLLSADAPFDEFIKALASGDPTGGDHLSPSARRGLRLFIGRGNCTVCHAGPLFTDGEFHNIAVPPLAPTPTGSAAGDPGVTGVTGSLGAGGANRAGTFDDSGRWAGEAKVLADPFNALGAFADTPRKNGRPTGPAADKLTLLLPSPDHWGEFKTPSLRHVAKTAPYMHQGQFASLDEVLHYYSTLEGAVRSGHHQEQILVPLHLTDGEKDDLIAFLTSLGAGIDDPTLLEPPRPGAAPASAGTNRQGR
ncbi:MAG: cytochrome c peroxidase, partial [Planctomycetota bacterium]|nr:cytochrome c peroxidase [Planctomycetota bacterium]